MAAGVVYLVGAGPGDPGLLTVRARQLLETADVVLYDGLVSRGVLNTIPPRVRRVRVGPGTTHRARWSQEKINERLVREARSGQRVVRLKGGDALLFSRGAEEVEHLVQEGVRYEVVPGITSAFAAPAYAGIPLTGRGLASSVGIATGHASESPSGRPVNWSGLARSVDTLVILMGVATLNEVARRLLDGGLPPETPVAAIEWGTTLRQRTLLFTLAEGTGAAIRRRLRSPSVLVVGPVAALASYLHWNPNETRWASARSLRTAGPPGGTGANRRSRARRPGSAV